MNRHTFCGAWFCLAAAWMAGGSSIACGQVMMQLQVNGAMLRQAAGNGWLPAEGDGVAIGDPWWDDAAPEPKAGNPDAAPAAAAGDGQADGEDPQGNREAMLRAQAEMVRTSARQQGMAILRRELSIVRQTCPSLERQQRALVLEAGRAAVDKAVEEQITAALGRRRGRQAVIEAVIGEALQKSVAANAAEGDEAAAYEAESGLRQERAKQATIAALVADVDRHAFLDDAEREALTKALAESYRERWRGALAVLQNGGLIAGNPQQGIDRCVEKALGAERKAEWLARRQEAGKRFAQAGGQFQPGRPAGVRVLGGGGVRGQLMIIQGGGQVGPAAEEPTVEVEGDK
jgi:hypothetical protein